MTEEDMTGVSKISRGRENVAAQQLFFPTEGLKGLE